MRAYKITPENQSVEAIDIADKDEIARLIGFDTVIADEIGNNGDRLYFDEDCFLRGTAGRFQIDKLIPVSGVGIIAGSGSGDVLADVAGSIEDIRSRTKFL
jgi:hypothetical protein